MESQCESSMQEDIVSVNESKTAQPEPELQDAEEEIRQQRFKRLMHLLNQSTFYTEFLMTKMNLRQETRKKKEIGVQKSNPSEQSSSAEKREKSPVPDRNLRERQLCEENCSPVRKLKRKEPDTERAVKKKKLVADRAYDISTVIDKETIEKVMQKKTEDPGSSHGKENKVGVKTRVTAYGHVVSAEQPVLLEGGSLRDYQLDALEWLKALYENGMNGILADEMGLGKTMEIIAFICHLLEMGCVGPFLIIAPLSTIPNWSLEFERFAPQVPVLIYHGTAEERFKLRNEIDKTKYMLEMDISPIVITSFEVPRQDSRVFQSRRWKYIIVDEGHRLKNPKSELARTLRTFPSENRLLLTGTPLQNNIAELWALLNFLLPEIFDDLGLFESWFSLDEVKDNSEKIIEQEEKNKIVSTMHQILVPFLLRRTKANVALSIPPKKEIVIYAPMTSIQHQLYESTVNCNIERLLRKEQEPVILDGPDGKRQKRKCALKKKSYIFKDDDFWDSDDSEAESESSSRTSVLEVVDQEDENYRVCLTMQNPSQQLKKIVNHPYLIHMPMIPGKKEIRVDEDLIKKSGKMMVLDALLAKLKSQGHKVLIFSTYVMILDLLEEYTLYRKYTYCRLDGQVNLDDRRDRIKQFNMDPNTFLFLISTRAGGLGINLTGADTVIIFDSDWNPQVDLQAQDRCHRIGQTKPVIIYRLVTAGTYDEKIVEAANAKRKLEKLIIQKDRFRMDRLNVRNLMSLQELKELLNSSDQCRVKPNGEVFTDEELEALLDRSDMTNDSDKKLLPLKTKIFKTVEE